MKNPMQLVRLALAMGLVISLSAIPALAQKYEVHPYAGGVFWSDFKAFDDQIGSFDLPNPGVFGLKGGMYATQNVMIEGNVGFLNQFTFRDARTESLWGLTWEGMAAYNFFPARFAGIFPYVSAGLGGLTLSTRGEENAPDPTEAFFVTDTEPFFNGGPIPRTTRSLVIEDSDTFFSFTYGGGLKAQRLWGPVGLRADFRGRTLPNFYSDTLHGFEMTGGLLFSWGER